MDHPLFKDQPYSEREAWEYLIANANFTEQQFRRGNDVFIIPRGSLATSYRKLSEKWLWSTNKVIRFLKVLKNGTMIETETEQNFLQINIVNYNAYQNIGIEKETETEQNKKHTRNTGGDINKEGKRKRKKDIPPTPSDENSSADLLTGLPVPEEPKREPTAAEVKLDEFIEHRREMKKPMTDAGIKALKSKLNRYHSEGYDILDMLDTAMERGWQTVYPPKEDQP